MILTLGRHGICIAPGHPDEVLDHQGQTKGQQHGMQRVPFVRGLIRWPPNPMPKAYSNRSDDQAGPKAGVIE